MDDRDSVVIDIYNNNSYSARKYYCSYCNSSLFPDTREDMKGAYVCIKCNIEYWPSLEQVKKSNNFDLPGPPTESHGNVIGDNDIAIATIDDPNKQLSETTYKRQKLSPLFKALEAQGFKITSYEER